MRDPEKRKKQRQAYRIKNHQRHKDYCRQRATEWTPEEYHKALENQDYACATCGKLAEDSPKGLLCADHCHKTKKKRKLLCMQCNIVLGAVDDNPLLLRTLANYLEEFSK